MKSGLRESLMLSLSKHLREPIPMKSELCESLMLSLSKHFREPIPMKSGLRESLMLSLSKHLDKLEARSLKLEVKKKQPSNDVLDGLLFFVMCLSHF